MSSFFWRKILYFVTFGLFAIAVVFFILSLTFWLVTEPGFEPLNVLAAALVSSLFGLLTLLGARTAPEPLISAAPSPNQQQRNREMMLGQVEHYWVKNVLEKSLYTEVIIQLDWQSRPSMVGVTLHDGHQEREVSPGTPMIEVFDWVGQNLLILGEPGSGKTTMLLELARDAIERARIDNTLPIPVVFNLSSWKDPKLSLTDWLKVELNTKYNIPKAIGTYWIECDALMLLLDGLDEVAEHIRRDCVRAINNFRNEHLVQLVVCSRIKDYEQLSTQLNLDSAVFINPLIPAQIVEYLGDDKKTRAVRATLRHDPDLQEVAKTPLMLSIMALAYQGMSEGELRPLGSVEARRNHLFNTYIARMFERREADTSYTTEQTIQWLAWLAQRMRQASLSVFLIEQIQPNWLKTDRQLWIYRILLTDTPLN